MQFNSKSLSMVPQFPVNFAELNNVQKTDDEVKLQPQALENIKMKWTYMFLNQILIGIKDDFIRTRYFNFIKSNQIDIVSDIFQRMDMDRKFKDELRWQ